jgi:stearoyl-CoA desaturase (delta-9 desaturase)
MVQGIGAVGLVYALVQGYSWQWWVLAYVVHFLYYAVGAGVGQHRYFSHNAFKAKPWAHWLLVFLATVGTHTSPNVYRAVHLKHHRHSDQPDDPHGFDRYGYRMFVNYLSTHYGVTLREYRKYSTPLTHRLFQRFYVFQFAWAGLLAAIDWRLFLFAYLIPNFTATLASAGALTLAHRFGYRNFDTQDKSTNVWWLWPLMFGEAWHNNHHQRPTATSTRVRWWELDPGYWVIAVLRQRR